MVGLLLVGMCLQNSSSISSRRTGANREQTDDREPVEGEIRGGFCLNRASAWRAGCEERVRAVVSETRARQKQSGLEGECFLPNRHAGF